MKPRRKQGYNKRLAAARSARKRVDAELEKWPAADRGCPDCGTQWALHDCPGKRKERVG